MYTDTQQEFIKFTWDWLEIGRELSDTLVIWDESDIKEHVVICYNRFVEDLLEHKTPFPIDFSQISKLIWDRYVREFYNMNISKIIKN